MASSPIPRRLELPPHTPRPHPKRFRQAVPIDPIEEVGIIDATSYGPRCPQGVDALHDVTSHLYLAMSTSGRQSEFECLNLNIYAPACSPIPEKRNGKGLPVLLWINGGALAYGRV
jgi:carboxylesterase type B